MWRSIVPAFVAAAIFAAASDGQAQETRTVTDGLDVSVQAVITMDTKPAYILTPEKCTTLQAGWKVIPESVKAEIVDVNLMDISGDADWKADKAEARTKLENDNTRICLVGYCEGPTAYTCSMHVRASWQERK